MSVLKTVIKDWVPPIVWRGAKRFRGCGTRFEGNFLNWQDASSNCHGYDAKFILDKVLESTLKVKRGEAASERDSVLFEEVEYTWPVAAGLMWAAAQSGGTLDVLDFGGALGSSYFQNRVFGSALASVRWSVVEQPHYVSVGNKYIADDCLRFYDSVEQCLLERQPNVVLLSSVLQYLPDPFKITQLVNAIQAKVIILDRTIVNRSANSKIHVQIVPPSIYAASYPCWSLSEPMLINAFKPKYNLLSKFSSLEFSALDTIDSYFNGYIFSTVQK
jgi:putative methyltransferase (TIGR04325 family)